MPSKPVPVSGALILANNRILIALRPANKHLGGYWEFPGGKIEEGETPAEGLARELREEFAITAVIEEEFTRNTHQYEDTVIEIIAFIVKEYEGELKNLEHDELKWVEVKDLLSYKLAPADIPVAERLISFGAAPFAA